MKSYAFTFASEIDVPMACLWEAVASMRGVNAELGPWLRMTAPPGAGEMRIDDAPVGRPLFGSWVLFCGLLPVD